MTDSPCKHKSESIEKQTPIVRVRGNGSLRVPKKVLYPVLITLVAAAVISIVSEVISSSRHRAVQKVSDKAQTMALQAVVKSIDKVGENLDKSVKQASEERATLRTLVQNQHREAAQNRETIRAHAASQRALLRSEIVELRDRIAKSEGDQSGMLRALETVEERLAALEAGG